MTEPTELDQAFQSTMAQATAAKAELIETMHRPVDAPTMLLIFEGLRAVRKTRRVAITKYRELKPLDT